MSTQYGTDGNDWIDVSAAGTLYGGRGDDILVGGRAHDVLYGGSGDDTIDSGAGNDVMFGGGGADVFYLEFHSHEDADGGQVGVGDGVDVIGDFHSKDKVEIARYDDGAGGGPLFGIAFGWFDANHDGVLGRGDEAHGVSVEPVTFRGHTAMSTVIDGGDVFVFADGSDMFHLTFWNYTGLVEHNFIDHLSLLDI